MVSPAATSGMVRRPVSVAAWSRLSRRQGCVAHFVPVRPCYWSATAERSSSDNRSATRVQLGSGRPTPDPRHRSWRRREARGRADRPLPGALVHAPLQRGRPCGRVIASNRPRFRSVTSFRKACGRSTSARYRHTPLSRAASGVKPRRSVVIHPVNGMILANRREAAQPALAARFPRQSNRDF